jgi:hypothetical protein
MPIRQYLVFVMRRVLHFVTSQQLVVPILFAGIFAFYQWKTSALHFDSLDAVCRSIWPYAFLVLVFWIVICWQAGSDLNQYLKAEQNTQPTLFLPNHDIYRKKKIDFPGWIMAALFSLPGLAFLVFVTLGWLHWVEPWRLAPFLPPSPEVDNSATPVRSAPISSRPRSYLAFEGNPEFTGPSPSDTAGSPFVGGSPLAFNVHFRATGPNSVSVTEQVFYAGRVTGLFNSNDDRWHEANLNQAIDEFFRILEKDRRSQKERQRSAHTMMSGDREFNTAYGWMDDLKNHRILTQSDLDLAKTGIETWFVISILTYSDGNATHHLRRCMWLSPPATPQSVWHFCGNKFPDSD